MKKKIVGTYTRMLRDVTNTSWKDRITNQQLYGNLQKASAIITKTTICWTLLTSDFAIMGPRALKKDRKAVRQ